MMYLSLLSLVAFSTAVTINDNTNAKEKLSTFDNINDEYIEIVNSVQDSWTAGHNFPSGTKFTDLNVLLGTIRTKAPIIKKVVVPDNVAVPKSFDARKHWPKCKSIRHIRNQGHCGSSWAVSAASAISDRLCISSHGKFNSELSAQHLLSCSATNGCIGGWPSWAWNYFVENGLPTGGEYRSKKGCQPYLIKPCINRAGSNGNPRQCPSTPFIETPECEKSCFNCKYHKGFRHDLHFGKSVYTVGSNVSAIQKEIMTKGPVAVVFNVHKDFYAYKKGVYETNTEEICGALAARIIGWGVENGKDYWLVANQWGEEWGDRGLIKFRRGRYECAIEEDVIAGVV